MEIPLSATTSTYASGPAPAPPKKGSGLAVAAFVIGVIALLLCWVPIVNNVVFFLALVGLVLGVPAYLGARKGKRSGKGLALASIILSLLAGAGVLATQALYSEVIDDVSDSVAQDTADAEAGRKTAASDDEQAAAEDSQTLALGEAAEIGDYTVTVTDVVKDANAMIEQANEFNEPPTNQYALVTATVTYNGAEESMPSVDLQATIAGSDARQYDSSAASVVTPLSEEASVTLTRGGSSKVDFAMDVPAAALEGGKVLIQETFNIGTDERAYWPIP
jgi:hypothetical protein